MAESTAITIKKFDSTDNNRWSLEIGILLEQKHDLGIVDSTEEAPDAKDGTEFKHGRSNMESHSQLFSSRWRGHCSSSMAFRKTQRRCEIS